MMSLPLKTIVGFFAIGLIFYAYVPYCWDTVKGKTKPHVYSWFIWGLVTAIAFAVQVSHAGGFGSYVTLWASIFCFTNFVFAMRNGDKDITLSDRVCLVLALVAIVLWLFAKQPLISILLATLIDLLAFAPTIRKSWLKPFEETLKSWVITVIRYALSVIALQHYNFLTVCYPATMVAACGLLCLLLIHRRRVVMLG